MRLTFCGWTFSVLGIAQLCGVALNFSFSMVSTTSFLNSGVYRLSGTPFGIKITPLVRHYITLSNKWGAVQKLSAAFFVAAKTEGRLIAASCLPGTHSPATQKNSFPTGFDSGGVECGDKFIYRRIRIGVP